jgi:hypothetical protein
MSRELRNKIAELSNRNHVELKAEVLELGLIDDIKSEMKEANRGGIKAIDLAHAAMKPAETSLKLNKALLIKIEKTSKAAKELGANEAVKTLETQKKQIKTNIKEIEGIISALNRI